MLNHIRPAIPTILNQDIHHHGQGGQVHQGPGAVHDDGDSGRVVHILQCTSV